MNKSLSRILLFSFLSFANVGLVNDNISPIFDVERYYEMKRNSELKKKKHYESIIREYFTHADSIKYMWDIHRWGVKDFWQTPHETDSLNTGDCEDKAFHANYNLGKAGLDLHILFCKLNYDSKVNHTVNTYEIGDSTYIVETASKTGCKIINKDTIDPRKHYIPLRLSEKHVSAVKDFEERSGIKLKVGNLKEN